jgi:uncharacterized SAM-dependent methyltransferase
MSRRFTIQTVEMMERRVVNQLRRRSINTGLYALGGESLANAWKKLADSHPPRTWDITRGPIRDNYRNERCVVDFGPGSGIPCFSAIRALLDQNQIEDIVLIDVLPAMLAMAEACLCRRTRATITSITADFMQDTDVINEVLNGFSTPKLFLCLGGTVNQFNQAQILGAFRAALKSEDRLLVGLNFFPPEHSEQFLRKLADAYSEQTESFGLQFLAACGIEPDCRQVFASFGEDDDNPTVQVIRVFYSFPSETILSVGREQVIFGEGERLQFMESRRFLASDIERHLRQYGLRVVASEYSPYSQGEHGLFLCCKRSLLPG